MMTKDSILSTQRESSKRLFESKLSAPQENILVTDDQEDYMSSLFLDKKVVRKFQDTFQNPKPTLSTLQRSVISVVTKSPKHQATESQIIRR